jgi:hypothetical protein
MGFCWIGDIVLVVGVVVVVVIVDVVVVDDFEVVWDSIIEDVDF